MDTSKIERPCTIRRLLFFAVLAMISALPALAEETLATPSVIFAPGDAVRIRVFPDTAGFPNGLYGIDQDGFIDLPIIGFVKVVGLTEEVLTDVIKQAYIDYLPHPNVQVRRHIRATLQGGFRNPGLLWVDPRTSLWDVVKHGGGTLRTDGLTKMRWERGGKIVQPSLIEQYQSGISLAGMGFKSGDQIAVLQNPERTNWEVFRSDVMPVISFVLSTATSALTTYFLLNNYFEQK